MAAGAGAADTDTAVGSGERVPAAVAPTAETRKMFSACGTRSETNSRRPSTSQSSRQAAPSILTAGDGRTTRLSADGKKIKDESTSVERRTKWDAGKLVSEVSGLGQGKIVETYTLDAEHKQLRVTLNIESAQRKATVNRVLQRRRQVA